MSEGNERQDQIKTKKIVHRVLRKKKIEKSEGRRDEKQFRRNGKLYSEVNGLELTVLGRKTTF